MIEFLSGYFVNYSGQVFSNKSGAIKEIKQYKNNHGYMQIRPWSNGEQLCLKVHRVVASAFIDNKDSKPCVNHIDGDKTNNNKKNLEWSTYQENNQHAARTMLNGSIKPLIGFCSDIGYWFRSTTHAAENGYSRKSVSQCCNGKQKTHNGMKWEFIK